MDYISTLLQAEQYVKVLFDTYADQELPYHNIRHTTQVVIHAREIAKFYQLKDPDLWIITVAAWFHDVGHLFGHLEGHEEIGSNVLSNFFTGADIPDDILDATVSCIMATRLNARPLTLNEMILCDADTYHFGTTQFRLTDSAVRREMELRTGTKHINWRTKSLKMLEQHQYYTDYCRDLLTPGVQRNMSWLRGLD